MTGSEVSEVVIPSSQSAPGTRPLFRVYLNISSGDLRLHTTSGQFKSAHAPLCSSSAPTAPPRAVLIL